VNTARPRDLKNRVLFVTNNVCYEVIFLEYHEKLMFRGFLSNNAQQWALKEVLDEKNLMKSNSREQRRLCDTLFYHMAMKEFELIDAHLNIKIEHEISTQDLARLNAHYHDKVYPPQSPKKVKELCGDGHKKIMMITDEPTKGKKPLTRNNGWFCIADPKSGRIWAMVPQVDPENNAVVTRALTKIIHNYKNVDCWIYDRNCKYMKIAKNIDKLSQIEFWAIVKLHAYGHDDKCPCSHLNNRIIKRRLANVNTVICEQTFAWFRGYAAIFNHLRPNRHEFTVMYFAKLHNAMINKGDLAHLPNTDLGRFKRRRVSVPYDCTESNKAKRAKKA